jgi:hypothetical protein
MWLRTIKNERIYTNLDFYNFTTKGKNSSQGKLKMNGEFPPEMWTEVLRSLGPNELIRARSVSTEFRGVVDGLVRELNANRLFVFGDGRILPMLDAPDVLDLWARGDVTRVDITGAPLSPQDWQTMVQRQVARAQTWELAHPNSLNQVLRDAEVIMSLSETANQINEKDAWLKAIAAARLRGEIVYVSGGRQVEPGLSDSAVWDLLIGNILNWEKGPRE